MDVFDQSWLVRAPGRPARVAAPDLIPPRWRVAWLPLCVVLTFLMIRVVTPHAPPAHDVGKAAPGQCADKPVAARIGQAAADQTVPAPRPCHTAVMRPA